MFAPYLPFVLLGIPAAIGILRMRKWGLWLVWGHLALVFVWNVWATFAGQQLSTISVPLEFVVQSLLLAIIFYWFSKNRDNFDGAQVVDHRASEQ
jgi:hypothetical protein